MITPTMTMGAVVAATVIVHFAYGQTAPHQWTGPAATHMTAPAALPAAAAARNAHFPQAVPLPNAWAVHPGAHFPAPQMAPVPQHTAAPLGSGMPSSAALGGGLAGIMPGASQHGLLSA